MNPSSFSEFLQYTLSQKEVSFVLAADEAEQKSFIATLQAQAFRQVNDVTALIAACKIPSKVFYVIDGTLPQSTYEFIAQYPTGHLSIFDKTTGAFQSVTPAYTDVAIVFITTKSTQKELVQKGITLLDKVGMVYQK